MSDTTNETRFIFNCGATRGDSNEAGVLVFTNATGMTESLAVAFYQAYLNLPWPTGTVPQMLVGKSDIDQVQSQLIGGAFV